VWYFDASALVKLVIEEDESQALGAQLSSTSGIASAIVRTELFRAVARRDHGKLADAIDLLARVELITVTSTLLDEAARLGPPTLRSLDAIHLASALAVRDELSAFVSYDARLLEAASALGLPVASPGL
jgi:uncharacterized protein